MLINNLSDAEFHQLLTMIVQGHEEIYPGKRTKVSMQFKRFLELRDRVPGTSHDEALFKSFFNQKELGELNMHGLIAQAYLRMAACFPEAKHGG